MSGAMHSLPSYAFMACIRTLLLRKVIILNSTQIRFRNGECLLNVYQQQKFKIRHKICYFYKVLQVSHNLFRSQ